MSNFESNFSKKDLRRQVADGFSEYTESKQQRLDRIDELKEMASKNSLDAETFKEYSQDVKYAQESIEEQKLRVEMEEAVTPFVKQKIASGELYLAGFGNHDHLNFEDDRFWGHYISATLGGVIVTVYQTDQIEGDPMDASGTRGEPKSIFIELDENDKSKLVATLQDRLQKLWKEMDKPDYEYHDWDSRTSDGLEEAIKLLSGKKEE